MKHLTATITLCLTIILSLTAMQHQRPKDNPEFEGYEKSWETVQGFDKVGQPASALKEVERILQFAREEENQPQLIKALLFSFKYTMILEEDAEVLVVGMIDKELQHTTDVVAASLLHSIKAQALWDYYRSNRYNFLERSATTVVLNDDFRTWDLRTLLSAVRENHLEALEPAAELRNHPINTFDYILLNERESELYRPTLYDLLVHRAIDFFKHAESGLAEPVAPFEFNDPEYFGDAAAFTGLALPENASMVRDALQLLQKLLAFRIKDGSPTALMDADLHRLEFVHAQSDLENKDLLYTDALMRMARDHEDVPFSAYIRYRVAAHWQAMSHGDAGADGMRDPNYRLMARDLCRETIDRYPGTDGALNCGNLLLDLERSSLSIQTERVLVPGQYEKVHVSYLNADNVAFRLIRLSRDEVQDFTGQRINDQKWLRQLADRKPFREWTAGLIDPGDLYEHTTEVAIEPLEKGAYVLFASHGTAFKSDISVAGVLWVSDLSYVTRTTDAGGMEVHVMDRTVGFPIKDAEVRAYFYQYDYDTRSNKRIELGTYFTSADGKVDIPSPEKGSNRNIWISLQKADDWLEAGDVQYLPRFSEAGDRWRQQTYFFTDRAIYRPGQTIYFKGVTVETNGSESRLLERREVTVTFRDVNGQEIGTADLVSNEYGSIHGSFTAPSGTLTGRMRISGGGGEAYISVEEYKRPTFEVVMDPVAGGYGLDEVVQATGTAVSYAGAPLPGATVRYRVVREVRYPYWHGSGYFRRPPYEGNAREIAHGQVETDQSGVFEISFTTEPDRSIPKKDDPRFRYTVHVDVVDITGETRSGSRTITAGYSGLDLRIDMDGRWDRTVPQSIGVSVTNLDGQAQDAIVDVRLYRLVPPNGLLREPAWDPVGIQRFTEEEYYERFGSDLFRLVKDAERPRELISTFSINTADTGSFIIPEGMLSASGEYWLEASTQDKFGNPVRFMGKAVASAPQDTRPAVPVHLSLSAEKAVLQPGDTAVVSVASSIPGVTVIYHLSHDGREKRSGLLELDNEIRKLEIPVSEADRGGLFIQCVVVYRNRVYREVLSLEVPFESTDLEIEWMTFRDLLQPGQQEEWKIRIKGPGGDAIQAELLAAMYDKSLDYFLPHAYNFNPSLHPYIRTAHRFSDAGNFDLTGNRVLDPFRSARPDYRHPAYTELNLFGFMLSDRAYRMYLRGGTGGEAYMMKSEVEVMADEAMPQMAYAADADAGIAEEAANGEGLEGAAPPAEVETELPDVAMRENLNETAFFFPNLETNADGDVILSFRMPDAVTAWKFLGFAHDKDLRSKIFSKEIRTQKDLMVTPNFPRFFRDGDRIRVTAKVDNLTGKTLDGKAVLVLKDALTGKEIHGRMVEGNEYPLSIPASGNAVAEWEVWVDGNFQAVSYEIYAVAGDFTDAVTSTLPVLTNRMMVTESMPVWLNGAGERTFTLDHLKEYTSATLSHHKYTLEYTSNPAWYAVQALPYLMEFPYECAEQLFSRYYANTLATHIASSNPAMKKVFDQWKTLQPDALLSNLEKNQELKSLLLEETPWLRDAESESERKKRIALLFDLNRMASERSAVLAKLEKMQSPNGGFSWFPGMPDNRYITQHILTGLAHLQQLGVQDAMEDETVRAIIDKAIPYLDARIREDLRDIRKGDKDFRKNDHLSSISIQYLYVRSHFRDYTPDAGTREAVDFFLEQSEKFWLNRSMYDQAMISIALHRFSRKETSAQIVVSLKEHAIVSEERGMYWKALEQGGYYWYNAPIEAQAMLIEAFHTVADDSESVNLMKIWLLKQKQVQDWRTTKATAEAVFALLLRGGDWLAETEMAEVRVGGTLVEPSEGGGTEAGTGYYKVGWSGDEIDRSMAEVTVSSKSGTPSWGAVYWQYFEDLDAIEQFEETPLKLRKQLYVETNSDSGPVITPLADHGALEPGDKIIVRIELTADRNMEFIHMKDMRASGFEPVNVLSGFRYQDGLGYYEATRDAATNFFFDHLPKGLHVFEYPLRVAHAGDFSNGITSVQSMYAPEFAGHSEGIRVGVGK